MNTPLRAAAAVLLFALVGCGNLHGGAAIPPKVPSTASSRPHVAPVAVRHTSLLNFAGPIHTSVNCDYANYAGTLTLSGVLGKDRAAAIVTLDGSGTPRWNTADGHRWTQAEANAAVSPTFEPWLYTPWRMHVTGAALRGQVPHVITGYLQGGTLGTDVVGGCHPTAVAVAGHSYLAVFGGELTTGLAAGAVQAPILDDLMSYDPATHVVQTRYGALSLSS